MRNQNEANEPQINTLKRKLIDSDPPPQHIALLFTGRTHKIAPFQFCTLPFLNPS